MKMKTIPVMVFLAFSLPAPAQQQDPSPQTLTKEDSLDTERLAKMVNLSEVLVRTDINVARFINQVKNDTTFYKAFRNLHLLGFTAWNDISVKDKKGKIKASLQSKTKQIRSHGCRN